MDEQERETARLLGTLRGVTPDGPGTVDLARARRAGRRRVAARRSLSVVTVVLTLVALVGGTTVLGRSLGSNGASPPLVPSSDQFTTRFPAFRVGSAGGFTPVGYENGRYVQRVTLHSDNGQGQHASNGLIELYARNRLPQVTADRIAAASPAEPVHGRRAVWLTPPVLREGAVELAWEWGPGAWAVVSLVGSQADQARAHRVAQSVVRSNSTSTPDLSPTTPSGTPSGTPSFTGTSTPSFTGDTSTP